MIPADFLDFFARTRRFSLGQPASVKVARDGTVLFTRTGPTDPTSRPFAFDPATGDERVIAELETLLGDAMEHVSPEERARRERLRQRTTGITSFHMCADDRHVLLPVSGRAYMLDRDTGESTELPGTGPMVDPKPSRDGRRVAWVHAGEVWVLDVANGVERRLSPPSEPDVTYGLAEFVAAEEMDRVDGYWWSPSGDHVVYTGVDTSDVDTWYLADLAHPGVPPTAWPYPRPGEANAEVRLFVVPATGGEAVEIRWDRTAFPYVARVEWSEDAPLTMLVQDRRQRREQVLLADQEIGATTVLLEESDDGWLNLMGPLRWLPDGTALAWLSERSGYKVLELVARDGTRRPVTHDGPGLHGVLDVTQETATVLASLEPTERHVARVDLATRAVEWLTRGPAVHGWAGGHGVDVITRRGLHGAPRFTVRATDGAERAIDSEAADPGFEPSVELVTVGGLEWRAAVIRPSSFEPGQRYPVLLDVYGGPSVQVVLAARDTHLERQWFAEHGFVVVAVDGRGTPGRGRDWERAIAGDLATIPLSDQIAALMALGERHRELDLDRVVVRGWSFGGYMSALAVLSRPDVFAGAVAGAPVTDWAYYDTHYTERYLGLPEDNPDGYAMGDLVARASETGLGRPLLLVHGTGDDNVFFSHSLRLAEALFRRGSAFELVPLPNLTHMADDTTTTVRVAERTAAFLAAAVATPGGHAGQST